MEYVWTFILISWWNNELMRIDTIKAADEAACNVKQHDMELMLEDQAERSGGMFIYSVGECKLIAPSPSET